MLYGIAFLACKKLIDRYPNGYILEELFEEVRGIQPALINSEMLMSAILSDKNGKPSKWSLVPCWERKEDGLIYFNPDAKESNPQYITVDFVTMYAKKLAEKAAKDREGD